MSDLQYLMHQLGPATPDITAIVQESIDCWMIEFDEGVSLQIAWDQRSARVLMKCAIGQPDESVREEIYALLLNANLQLTGVADVKLALSDIDEDVVLIGEYDLDDASIEGLRRQLSEFLGFAEKFSQMIAGSASDELAENTRSLLGLHDERA